MTTRTIPRRLERIEEGRRARWWTLCEELHGEFLRTLTDDELLAVAASYGTGAVPTWWPARFVAFADGDPRWREAVALENGLRTAGYSLVTDERGAVVWPGLERRL